jgi:hypothetical protein
MKIPSPIAALPFAMALFSCSASRQGIPPLSFQDKLAVVAFHFDGFSDASSEPGERHRVERGPGTSPRSDAASLSDEQLALDSVWIRFQAGLPAALGTSILPSQEVVSNPAYSEFPAHEPSATKGLEPTSGFRSVEFSDTAKLRNLALSLGANKLLLVECWADYDTTAAGPALAAPVYSGSIPGWKPTDSTKITKDSSKFTKDSTKLGKAADSLKTTKASKDTAKDRGNQVAAQAPKRPAQKSVKVVFHAVLRFYQVGKGVYWTGRYMAGTKTSADLTAGQVPASFLPPHLSETVNPILMRISQDAALGRGMTD